MGELYSVSSDAASLYPATPVQHAYALHPPKAQGRVTVARKLPELKGWEEQTWAPWELDAVLHGADGQADTYVSQNRFRGRRRAISQVAELCAVFGDLDYYKVPELRGLPPEAVLVKALGLLQKAGAPRPSLAFCSGRGLCAVWSHDPVGRKELPVWNACQDRLHVLLRPLGADPLAKHAATVLRLSGTVNSKNDAVVRSLIEPRENLYRFWGMAKTLLENTLSKDEEQSAELDTDLRNHADRSVALSLRNHPQGWSEESLWEGRLTDLQHLRRMRYGDGPMEDFRDRWLFIACTAVSWLVEPEALEREVFALAEEAGGWDPHRTRSDLSQVLKRARMAASGKETEFKGRLYDPRHYFTNKTIIDWLEITAQEEREMVVTISPEEERRHKRHRDKKYQANKRRAAGVPTRAKYDQDRNGVLRKKMAVARQLKNCNVPTQQIAERMGVSERTVQRWLKK